MFLTTRNDRWDLTKGQRGQIDRIPVAHSGPILSVDWCPTPSSYSQSTGGSSFGNLTEPSAPSGSTSASGSSNGWIASAGLDHIVKVWDLTSPSNASHISHTPTYRLSTSFPVRRVLWRPGYECELAVVSHAEFGTGSMQDMMATSPPMGTSEEATMQQEGERDVDGATIPSVAKGGNDSGDPVEIWDVRREWIAKWVVGGSAVEGGVTGKSAIPTCKCWRYADA